MRTSAPPMGRLDGTAAQLARHCLQATCTPHCSAAGMGCSNLPLLCRKPVSQECEDLIARMLTPDHAAVSRAAWGPAAAERRGAAEQHGSAARQGSAERRMAPKHSLLNVQVLKVSSLCPPPACSAAPLPRLSSTPGSKSEPCCPALTAAVARHPLRTPSRRAAPRQHVPAPPCPLCHWLISTSRAPLVSVCQEPAARHA